MLSQPTEQIKREDEESLKNFMLIIRKLRKSLYFKRKEFACIMGLRDDVYIKFETTGKAAATTLYRLYVGLAKLGVNMNKLLSLKSVDEYDINDLMSYEDRGVAVFLAIDTKINLKRYKQRRKENFGPPYLFECVPVGEAMFDTIENERRYGKTPIEPNVFEEEKDPIRIEQDYLDLFLTRMKNNDLKKENPYEGIDGVTILSHINFTTDK